MRNVFSIIVVILSVAVNGFAQPITVPSSQPAAMMPALPTPAQDTAFAARVDLSELRKITIQDRQTLKTLDTFARQILTDITGKSSLDGQDPVFTILDIAFRGDKYADRNLIKIRNVPLRQDFLRLTHLPSSERDRILKEGTISLQTWVSPQVQELMAQLQSTAIFKANAIGQVTEAAGRMAQLGTRFGDLAFVPPPPAKPDDTTWRGIASLMGNVRQFTDADHRDGRTPPKAAQGYDDTVVGDAVVQLASLMFAWGSSDADAVNALARSLPDALVKVNPAQYPSQLNRDVEIVYNRLAKLTIPGAFLYFAAFVAFLVSARSGVVAVRMWALRLFVLAFFVHTVGIGVRWWLVASQHGNWFDGIPIKNQFESVLMSAWFGALIGLVLELRRSRAIFGAAASFVGWLSLVAIFATPYVTGVEIGAEIGHVAGVLMSYWLYLHVTLVVASYALITMGFGLSVWWLWSYYKNYGTLKQVPSRRLSSDAIDLDTMPAGVGPGGAIQLGFARTLASVLFGAGARVETAKPQAATIEYQSSDTVAQKFLATLDACNLVILQSAFWVLGVGIILGAVWADQSWGRPWGWDPKETFALVTWIVYLIVVHVRVATADKAWWTAVLSIVGFFVMLFNWIGVNFFLVGLHSYA
jgi:cytochrome c-type biogenesis protein CcsB